MVLIASLVVKPGERDARVLPFRIVRASGPLPVSGSLTKFRRGILGKIVRKSLPVKPHPETVIENQSLMMCNCLEMLPRISFLHLRTAIKITILLGDTSTDFSSGPISFSVPASQNTCSREVSARITHR